MGTPRTGRIPIFAETVAKVVPLMRIQMVELTEEVVETVVRRATWVKVTDGRRACNLKRAGPLSVHRFEGFSMSRLSKLAVVALLVASGCASSRAAAARYAFLKQEMDGYAFQVPVEDVLAMTRMVLIEKGLSPRDVGANVLETDFAYSEMSGRAGSSSTATRYIATALAVGNGSRLSIVMTSQSSMRGSAGSSTHNTTQRAYELEADVLRRLDPADGNRILAEAEVQAKAAAEAK
jgi:hypothetical protein